MPATACPVVGTVVVGVLTIEGCAGKAIGVSGEGLAARLTSPAAGILATHAIDALIGGTLACRRARIAVMFLVGALVVVAPGVVFVIAVAIGGAA